jgi:antitoxin (DNA-binding transcriptional repressor) of toxin-antitoxin stability system
VRELKSGLSRYLRHVRNGARVTVTERGKAIATIGPVDGQADAEWAHRMVVSGKAQWSGGKPAGARHPGSAVRGRSVSAAVVEDRR